MRVDELIEELQNLVADAKTMPLSGGKVIIEADKIYDILDEKNRTSLEAIALTEESIAFFEKAGIGAVEENRP